MKKKKFSSIRGGTGGSCWSEEEASVKQGKALLLNRGTQSDRFRSRRRGRGALVVAGEKLVRAWWVVQIRIRRSGNTFSTSLGNLAHLLHHSLHVLSRDRVSTAQEIAVSCEDGATARQKESALRRHPADVEIVARCLSSSSDGGMVRHAASEIVRWSCANETHDRWMSI